MLGALRVPRPEGMDERLRCMACGVIHSKARVIKVADGREIGNYSEEWRLYCEARWLLTKKRTKRTRQDYLQKVIEKRGEMAAHQLRQEMLRQWKHSQA